MACEHRNFLANVTVNRLEDVGRFVAEVKIECEDCKVPFRFLNVPVGMDLDGVTVSFDGTEVRLAVAPKDETVPPIPDGGVAGYRIVPRK